MVSCGDNDVAFFLSTPVERSQNVLKVVGDFVPDIKNVYVSTCHDGAVNMVKTSQLLKVENFQHCTAHAMHLLLTVDSINQAEEIVSVLQKCRNIVSCLHFKSMVLEEELAETDDNKQSLTNYRRICATRPLSYSIFTINILLQKMVPRNLISISV